MSLLHAATEHLGESRPLDGGAPSRRRFGRVTAWTVLGLIALRSGTASAQDDVDAEIDALENEVPEQPADTAERPPPPADTAEQPPPPADTAEQPAPPPPAPSGSDESTATPSTTELDEVVVTVDRRRKSLQDYSGVAAAFSESKLASVGVTNVRDLSQMVPGLQIGVQDGNTEVYIRGIGSDNNTELGDPGVALHVDGVYMPRPRGLGSMFYDVARVEVSSGPQGTLRGRNALGGTVNVVSNQPKLGTYEANAQATFGTFHQRRYQGMLNFPLGDVLAVRVAGFSEVRDPYWENGGSVYDVPAGESADAMSLRAQIMYEPTASFSALAAFDFTREAGTPYLGANLIGPLTETDADGATIPFDPNGFDNPRRTYLRGMNPSSELEHWGARLTLAYDLGPATVEALGSFRRMRFNQNTGANAGVVYEGYDYLGQNTDVYSNGFWDTRSDSVVAELRAYAPDTARLRWTVGAFFFDEQQDAFLGQVNDGNFFGGGEFNMPGVTGRSLAGYADATFDVTPSLRVLGGVRVTRDEKTRFNGLWSLFTGWPGGNEELGDVRFGTEGFRYEGFGRNQYVLPDNYANLSPQEQATERVNMFLAGVESFGGRDNLPLFLCDENGFGEDGTALPVLEPNAVGSGWQCANGIAEGVNVDILQMVPQNSSTNPTFFDWRAGVEYDLAKDNLLYATVSTGHKSGGFNDTSPGLQQGQLFNSSYEPEDVLALELGSKNLLADRRMRLNASAFAYLYNDYVFQTIVSVGEPDAVDENGDPLSAGTAVRQNAASATIYGLDVDLSYRLPLGLEAEVHALFMDARFGDETLVNDSRIGFGGNDNYVVDIAGNWLPRASPYTINFALSQLIFSSIGAFDWVISGQTRGQHYMSVYNGDGQVLEPADGQPRAQTFIDGDGNEQLTAYGALTASDAAAQRLTDVVPTYTRFDVGAGWRHPDGRIAVSAYVNNALNLAYTTSVIATPNTNLRFYNPPRQAGVRFRVDW